MRKTFWRSVLLVVAQTVGAGLFGIPFIFAASGWAAGLTYLFVIALILSFVHRLYARALDKAGSHHRLVGLLARYFGKNGRLLGLFVVLGGLILTLVIYLVLGARLVGLVFPVLGVWSLPVFWLLVSLPLFFRTRKFFVTESVGVAIVLALVLFVFYLGLPQGWLSGPLLVPDKILFPFGAIVFALAGWPAVQQVLRYCRERGFSIYEIENVLTAGTFIAAAIYAIFAFGVLGYLRGALSGSLDSLLVGSPYFVGTIVALGIFSIWNAYGPISREIEASFHEDLGWSVSSSIVAVFFLPPLLVSFGLKNFISIASLVGGLFLGFQYVLLLYVADKVAGLRTHHYLFSALLKVLFTVAAIYEIYYFIVR